MAWKILVAAASAYLLGSVPFGYLLYRFRQGGDIRNAGSGNIGATNVVRTVGIAAGAATLLLDAGKGYAAVALAGYLSMGSPEAAPAAAFAAILGHMYPVFLKFRGGKGVATGLGAFLAISPPSVLICAVLFLVTAFLSRYVSLASMAAVGAFPLVLMVRGEATPLAQLAALLSVVLILFRHRSNWRRLRSGMEPPIFGRGRTS
jgi:glycerol-3-phosphate acyltransferase PlsY